MESSGVHMEYGGDRQDLPNLNITTTIHSCGAPMFALLRAILQIVALSVLLCIGMYEDLNYLL